jgi:hypothetical protein
VHDSLDAGTRGGVEELKRVVDGDRMAEIGRVETDPIGVVQHLGARERPGQLVRCVEVERVCLDAISKRVGAARGVGERPDATTGIE